MNNICLSGRIKGNIRREMNHSVVVVKFTVVTLDVYETINGKRKEYIEHPVTYIGEQALWLLENASDGDHVNIIGRLTYFKEYLEDGDCIKSANVIANRVNLVRV